MPRYDLLQPEMAGAVGRTKAEALRRSGAELVLTGNPGCMLQIDSHLRQIGYEAPVRHPIELLLPPE